MPVSEVKEPLAADYLAYDLNAAKLLGMHKALSDDMVLIDATRNGIKKEKLTAIASALGLDQEALCSILHMSVRTFQRLPAGSNLDIYSSEQAIELALVLAKARELFQNDLTLQKWFNSPLLALNSHSPASVMDTSFGARLVMKVLGKLEHGVYS